MSGPLSFAQAPWYDFLDPEGKDLVAQSVTLLLREERLRSSLSDYTFVVFPMAKAYEGFIKKFLYQLGVLDQVWYLSTTFRIGRALNPDLPAHQRDAHWLYDDVANMCTHAVAKQLWDTWLSCRNHLFHYIPEGSFETTTLPEAKLKLLKLSETMTAAISCTMHGRAPY
jgi:hypothetical protein